MRNFKSFPSFFDIGANVDDSEKIFVISIVNRNDSTRIIKFLFIFFLWPVLFRLHNFRVIFSYDLWRIPSFYDYFQTLVFQWLKKDNHTILPITIVCTIKNLCSIYKSSLFCIIHLEQDVQKTLKLIKPEQDAFSDANWNCVQ